MAHRINGEHDTCVGYPLASAAKSNRRIAKTRNFGRRADRLNYGRVDMRFLTPLLSMCAFLLLGCNRDLTENQARAHIHDTQLGYMTILEITRAGGGYDFVARDGTNPNLCVGRVERADDWKGTITHEFTCSSANGLVADWHPETR